MEIAILTQTVTPPVSLAQIRRVKTHNDTVIANCFFSRVFSRFNKDGIGIGNV